MSLDQTALYHGTDKSSEHHGYAAIYEQEIDTTRPEGSLLELGWLDGASMRMWRDWLPYRWKVTGLDIEPKEPLFGVNFVLGSQDDPHVVLPAAEQFGPFDVIVDDASHESHRTIESLRMLWNHLRPGGLYFIEDLRTSYLAHWNQGYGESIMEFLKRRADNVHRESGRDDGGWEDITQVSFWPGLCMLRKEG